MINTERPVIEWLRTIADPIVRESAIRQCTEPNAFVDSLEMAISVGMTWSATKEGRLYWVGIWKSACCDKLATIEIPTIDPAETNWMDEVHTMD